MKQRTKIIFATLFIISLVFLLQNRVRQEFFSPTLEKQTAAFFEEAYTKGCQQNQSAIVPCEWYTSEKLMPPLYAGMIDGAYISGKSIVDLAQLSWLYFNDRETYNDVNEALQQLWLNRHEILPALKQVAIEKGIKLSDATNADIAEYEYGKLLFDVGSLFIGVGELSVSVKNIKFVDKAVKTIRKSSKRAKLLSIKAKCKPCAKIFKNRSKLRDEFLVHNIEETKRLLSKEWKASGKTWDNFIKDYEAHHVIPVDMLGKSDCLHFYFNNGGKLDFNSLENGMLLRKVTLGGEHAYHPVYNRYVALRLKEIEKSTKSLDKGIRVKLIENNIMNLISDLKLTISEKSIKGGQRVNELFN